MNPAAVPSDDARATMHERVVAAASDLTLEVGSKPRLAEEMVLAELSKFLAAVDAAFDRHPTELIAAIRDAACGVLELARTNALLQAVVSRSYGAETELLPLLTTRNDALVLAATQAVQARISVYPIDIDDRHLDAAVDMVVRLVLSHVIHPVATPADTADDIAWIVGRTLRP